ncbi:MAG: hypothetical protein QM723_32205 [Myxococcaceae bacterium]
MLPLMLLLVQGDWKVEHAPVLPPAWVAVDAHPGSDSTLLVLGQTDGGTGLFAVVPGEPAALLSRDNGQLIGAALAIDEGDAGTRVRALATRPQPHLVDLGRFDGATWASCSSDGNVCGVARPEGVELIAAGKHRTIAAESVRSVVVKPDGTWAVFDRDREQYLARLEKPALWLVMPTFSWQVKDVADGQARLEKRMASQGDGALPNDEFCTAGLSSWSDGDGADFELGTYSEGVGAPECSQKVMAFSLSLKSFARTPLPTPKWQPLECPKGGWSNPKGALTMQCQRLNPVKRSHETGPRLPEALSLDDDTVFILAEGHTSFSYTPKGVKTALPVTLEGPSVVTFGARSVTVQPVSWPEGLALDGTLLEDDWHLSGFGSNLQLYRFVH